MSDAVEPHGQTRDRLAAVAARAQRLIAAVPAEGNGVVRERGEVERLNQVIDAQELLACDGEAAPLAEPVPDSIPMTGEEDPIVEVDDPEFAGIVAEFMRSERDAREVHGNAARARLAQALLPFADTTHSASALLHAIDRPFSDFVARAEQRPHAADRLLTETLIAIARRALDAA